MSSVTPDEPEEVEEPEAIAAELVDQASASELAQAYEENDRQMVPQGALERFLSELKHYPQLADEEERALARKARTGQDSDAARKLVVHNLRLVVAIAYEFRRAWTNVLDLIQEGSVGLSMASTRWDPDRGARFGSYAAYWIRAYVLKFLLTNYRLVHAGNTRAGRRLFFQLDREKQRLLNAGEEPTREKIAEAIGVAPADVDDVSRLLGSSEVALDAPLGEEGRPMIDSVEGDAESPEHAASRGETNQAIRLLMEEFGASRTDPRERAVWFEHLLAEQPASLATLGARFGQSKQLMGQMANKLKKTFHQALIDKFGPEVELSWWSEAG